MSDHKAQAAQAESARLELGLAAATAERRNRPKMYLVLGAVLLGAACVYAYMGWSARSSAMAELTKSRDTTSGLQRLAGEIVQMRQREQARGLTPNPRMAAMLESMAQAAGFKLNGAVSDADDSNLPSANLVQKKYSARASNQDPAALLRFLQATQGPETPGLEIKRLSIRPTMGAPTPGADGSAAGGWTIA